MGTTVAVRNCGGEIHPQEQDIGEAAVKKYQLLSGGRLVLSLVPGNLAAPHMSAYP
jgi:hypothetical protein